jgi:alanyl-tRNA synthetase
MELTYPKLKFGEYFESYEYIINRKNELNVLREQVKELDKLITKVKKEKFVIPLDEYLKNMLTINNYNVLISKTFNLDVDTLKDLSDRLADSLDDVIVFLANVTTEGIVYICKNKIAKLQAGSLVKLAANLTDGKGGGRNDFAQAGGKSIEKLDFAIDQVLSKVKEMI